MTASAPNSEVAICNLALSYLNEKPITSIDAPPTSTAALCAIWYHASRREALRRHPWNFAKTRAVASRDSTAPVHSWADAYNLPPTLIRLTHIGDDSLKDFKFRYEFEGRQLLLDNSGATSINIGFISDETDVTKFDPGFVIVCALTMAKNMTMRLTGKRTIMDFLKKELVETLRDFTSVDGQERPPIRIEQSKLIQKRRSLMGSAYAGPNVEFTT